MARELIAADTAQVTTKAEIEATQARLPITLLAHGLAGVEEVDIFISPDGGATWQAYYEGGSIITLTATIPHFALTAPGHYGVTKDATAGAAGVVAAYLDDV